MGTGDGWGLARQVALVVGAVFQILAGFLLPVGEIAGATRSLIIPADYAFGIWGLIFLLCLIAAVYGALPVGREDPLLRRVGWPLAAAFFLNGVWEVSVLLRQPLVLQVLIGGIFACAAVAYVRLVSSGRDVLGGVDRWLVAPTVGLLFGWITAANAISFNDMLVDLELMGAGTGAALVSAFLLLAGTLVACAMVLVGPERRKATWPTRRRSCGGWSVSWSTSTMPRSLRAALRCSPPRSSHWSSSALRVGARRIEEPTGPCGPEPRRVRTVTPCAFPRDLEEVEDCDRLG